MQASSRWLHANHSFRRFQKLARLPQPRPLHLVAVVLELVPQGVGSVDANQAAAMKQAHATAALSFVQIRGGDEYGDAVLHQLVENGPEIAAGNRVDTVRRLIQKQYLGAMQQRA